MRKTCSDRKLESGGAGLKSLVAVCGIVILVIAARFFLVRLSPPSADSVSLQHRPVGPASIPGKNGAPSKNASGERPDRTFQSYEGINQSAEARVLLDRIFKTEAANGELTRDQVTAINASLEELAKLRGGSAGMIREYLDTDLDLTLPKSLSETGKAAYSSVRIALFDILKEIGGEEGMDALLHVLKTTADPLEIAILSRNINQMAPDEHRSEILQAARESLDQALRVPAQSNDAAPLFQVLQRFGDPSVIPDLEKALPKWNYYAALSLASLPNGQGVPSLVRELDDPAAIASGQDAAALQVLSQVSYEDPTAREALVSRAKADQIPDSSWAAVANTLAGLHYEFGSTLSEGSPTPPREIQLPKYKVGTDQTLFSTPTTPSFLEEQIPDRLAMVDQLLASTTNPVAIEELQKARASLQSKAMAAAVHP